MLIKQVLNNNVVMAYDDNKVEVVVVGTGIGFHAKKNDLIDKAKIQKIFSCTADNKFKDFVGQISPEILELTQKISANAKEEFAIVLEDEVFMLLADHINFAIKRLREGMDLDNPFLYEIKHFFKDEYKIGLYAKDLIKEMFNLEIPDEEVGYICMHLISSEFHQNRSSVNKVFKIIDVSINYLQEHYLKDVQEDSIAYNRLMNHIKFFAKRYAENEESDKEDVLLDTTIKDVFKQEVSCIDALSELLLEKFGRKVTQSEKNYIILHLRNCRKNI